MADNLLQFRVLSGGTVTIALDRCVDCAARPCLEVCRVQGGPLVLDEERGWPMLRWSSAEVERGGCVECMGCELSCQLSGRAAVTIDLPLEQFEHYLDSLNQPLSMRGESCPSWLTNIQKS